MNEVDFHFYNGWASARDNGDMFVLSKFHVLPRQGGWGDQDYYEAQDLLTYLRGYTWAYRQNHPQEGDEKPDRGNPFEFQREGAVTEIADFVN